MVTTAWAKDLDPLPLTPPPPKKKGKGNRNVNLPSNLNSFLIKEETKIDINILTVLKATPIPLPPHKIIKTLKENKDSKGRNLNRIKYYFQVLKSNTTSLLRTIYKILKSNPNVSIQSLNTLVVLALSVGSYNVSSESY